jgi:hypothetical protein
VEAVVNKIYLIIILLIGILLTSTVLAQENTTTTTLNETAPPDIVIPQPQTGKARELWDRFSIWLTHSMEIAFQKANINPFLVIFLLLIVVVITFFMYRWAGVDTWIPWFLVIMVLLIFIFLVGVPFIMGFLK